jgi:DICT domain-containing protein
MLDGSILQALHLAHPSDERGSRSLNFGVYYKNTLVALCHALEDSILAADSTPLMITAFQRGKWYLEEAERYGAIAAQAQDVVILAADDAGFAAHPTSQRQNVHLVTLAPTDPVAQEWHLIIVSPDYTAMVLCQELSTADYGELGLPQHDLERRFYGFWTFEPDLVFETAALAIAHIQAYDPALHRRLSQQLASLAAQAQSPTAPCRQPSSDRLGDVVSRVVDYLSRHQQDLAPQRRSRHLDQNLTSNELQAFLRAAQLIDQADLQNPMAAAEVATLAEAMGHLLDLPTWQLHRLRLAGLLHRLAILGDRPLDPVTNTMDPPDAPACTLLPGTQVLRTMPRLRAIATIITHQTEWWNGEGQPAGLSGDDIPLESRILGLVSTYQHHLAERLRDRAPDADPWLDAFVACQVHQGDRWDPKLLETLQLLVNGLRQGVQLPIALPKIAAGLWLLDSHCEENPLARFSDMPTSLSSP